MQTTFYILYVQKEFVSPGEDDVEEIFYVGRTSDPLQSRLNAHIRDGRNKEFQKGRYIYELLVNQRKFVLERLQRPVHGTR